MRCMTVSIGNPNAAKYFVVAYPLLVALAVVGDPDTVEG